MSSDEPRNNILDLLPVGVCIFDHDWKILFWNSVLESWSGRQCEDMLGKRLPEIFEEISSPAIKVRIESVMEGGPPHTYLIPRPLPSGEMRSQQIHVHDLQDGTVMLSIQDVTEQTQCSDEAKRMRDEILEIKLELERSNDEFEWFVHGASHDLRAPLRKIRMFLDLLTEDLELEEQTEDYFNVVIRSALRMEQLIKDLLEFVRADRDTGEQPTVDLNVIVEGVSSDIADQQVTVEIEGPLPSVALYETRARIIFQNLISNAKKYGQDEVPTKVRVFVDELTSTSVSIGIQDNGRGIEPEYLTKIFEPFKRLVGASVAEGSGIGLATVQKILRSSHGEIRVESMIGVGTTFYVTVPLAEAQAA